ncbi:Cytochrome c oxidase subunit 6A, variant 2 [Lathyrus oleraceus]|uniref:Cytochrome c oxidase subunit 6A, variant 2 n=1 Tax=Pisum sativum TaxID=3888 RepID=A0A9D5AQK4_PEA|nr:Cytochrome c oxidase subunit 6A, variant 2 [Pisum sativum]
MATTLARSGFLRNVLRRGGSGSSPAPKRSFSSSSHYDDAHETAKWEKITYLGIVSCTALATYILSKGHHHYDAPPVLMGYLKSRKSTTRSISGFMKVVYGD